MKRVIIVHQWGSSSKNDWYPWAKKELEKLGNQVLVPEMPDTDEPKIERWIPVLAEIVGEPKETDILIGHSIGSQTILRYLENLSSGQKVNKVITVAGWFKLTGLGEEERDIAKPWLKTSINFEKVKTKADKFTAIFSDNDLYVPLRENTQIFKQKLEAEIIIEKEKGHFTEDDGITQLPLLLDIV